MTQNKTDIDKLAEGVITGDRLALSRAITLVESDHAGHRKMAASLMEQIVIHRKPSIRIGITGPPGVGKSTFIESFGLYLVQKHQLRVAVLAIDPSSTKTGGSILGDKTRMQELSREKEVFIRPSPSRGNPGGVAAATLESIYLLEAAGFDVIVVETVGVGQSETTVHGMVDFFLLLIQPASGDQLQGIKRGIMEMADGIVVNKADGSLKDKAVETAKEFTMAVQLMPAVRDDWRTKVIHCSALESRNLESVWKMVKEFGETRRGNGSWLKNRTDQELTWFDHSIREGLAGLLMNNHDWIQRSRSVRDKIRSGEISPFQGSALMLSKVRFSLLD